MEETASEFEFPLAEATGTDRWQAYTGMTRAEITAAFYRRYGVTPERVFESGPITLAGPVPRKEVRAWLLDMQ